MGVCRQPHPRQELPMTTEAITPLRQRMIEDMTARKLCAGTQRGHILSCKRFAAFLKRSPDTATLEDIRRFQLHLAEIGVSICNRNCIMTGLRFLFRVTLRRLDLAGEVYHIREPQKIPLVTGPDETRRLNAATEALAGLVERVTFHNEENGFCVLRVKARGQRDLITVPGHAAMISAGEFIQASGAWQNDRTHGV